jgi:hypothetical protein
MRDEYLNALRERGRMIEKSILDQIQALEKDFGVVVQSIQVNHAITMGKPPETTWVAIEVKVPMAGGRT